MLRTQLLQRALLFAPTADAPDACAHRQLREFEERFETALGALGQIFAPGGARS